MAQFLRRSVSSGTLRGGRFRSAAEFPGVVAMQLIPAIDLKAGRCVRLFKGDFADETRYPIEPQALLHKYRQLGATWLHVVDLDGAQGAGRDNRNIILELAQQSSIK